MPTYVVVLWMLFLAACGGPSGGPDPSDILGPYEATGEVTATGASLHRRGTHVLLMDGRKRFYLESRTIDLGSYERKVVSIKGEVEPNTHPSFLPVFRVDQIEETGEASSTEPQDYDVPSLGLSLSAPADWVSVVEGGEMTFQHPEEDAPFARIARVEVDPLPQGLYIRIDGKNGVRIVNEEERQHRVYIETGDGVTLFTFAPKGEDSITLRDEFYTMLQSVDFAEAEDTSVGEDPEVDEGPFIPCGGPAGVLCPEGMFCEVVELDTGIGRCKAVKPVEEGSEE